MKLGNYKLSITGQQKIPSIAFLFSAIPSDSPTVGVDMKATKAREARSKVTKIILTHLTLLHLQQMWVKLSIPQRSNKLSKPFSHSLPAVKMFNECSTREGKNFIKKKTIRQFPKCFCGTSSANFMQAKRIWVEHESYVDSEESFKHPKTLSTVPRVNGTRPHTFFKWKSDQVVEGSAHST